MLNRGIGFQPVNEWNRRGWWMKSMDENDPASLASSLSFDG